MEEIYLVFDSDDVGNTITRTALRGGDVVSLSNGIREARIAIAGSLSSRGADIVFSDGDNVLALIQAKRFDDHLVGCLQKMHIHVSGHTVSIGTGVTPMEAHGALIIAKDLSGKGQIVSWNPSMMEKLNEIHQREEGLRVATAPIGYDKITDPKARAMVMAADAAEDLYLEALSRRKTMERRVLGSRGYKNWIDPNGQSFPIIHQTHNEWVDANFNVGTPSIEFEEYRKQFGSPEEVTGAHLVDAGWIRARGLNFEFSEARRQTIGIIEDIIISINPSPFDSIHMDYSGGSLNFTYRDMVEEGSLAAIFQNQARYKFAKLDGAMEERIKELESISFVDPVIGIWNRRFAEMVINREIASKGASIMHFSIDGGSDVLKDCAAILSEEVAEEDTLASWGNGELVVIVPDIVGSDHTADNAELIRRSIEKKSSFTVSIGTSRANPGSDPIDMITAASRALYEAKNGRHGRVVSAEIRKLGASGERQYVFSHAGPDIAPHVHKQDMSMPVLQDLLDQGYDQCIWRLSTLHDEQDGYDICDELAGNEFSIEALISEADYEAPIFSKSHVGCACFLECYSTTDPALPPVNVSAGDTWA